MLRFTRLHIKNHIKSAGKIQYRSISNATPVAKPIAYWLLGMSGLVGGMVTVGGITRLTRSGLSMTDWKLQGSLPPMGSDEWEKEFARYKTFPEGKQRQGMTLEEFKYIYFWEYGHRMMGRFVGVAFAVPFVYFSARKMIPKHLYGRLAVLFGLGGTQGLIGWWMVKSGLTKEGTADAVAVNKEVRVSPYRLATHLTMAFTTYSLLLSTALDILLPTSTVKSIGEAFPSSLLKHAQRTRRLALITTGLVGVTALSGAFVAGNDAGRAFNTFPKMGDSWVPDEVLDMKPTWRNFFENTATVQLDHRVLALTTLGSVVALGTQAISSPHWNVMPTLSRNAVRLVSTVAGAQVCLGIATLLAYVPLHLGVMHQAGSLILLTSSIGLIHAMRFTKYGKALGSVAQVAGSKVAKIL